MESHNHPSYIEPYQGAATGVGGILRDVFTMGARPIANLNVLHFGSPDHPETAHLVKGVVAGVGDYGNCIGVPTVGGQVVFHPSYDGNILANAFTLGLLRSDKIFRGYASGVGNPVLYVGSKTGRDGIHGATMASAEFSEATEEKRPTVQVGDPFTEKTSPGSVPGAHGRGCHRGNQDMGAAGLTSSSFEMAGRAGSGIRMDLDKVPMREQGMTPYEVLLSESQERMLHRGTEGQGAARQGHLLQVGPRRGSNRRRHRFRPGRDFLARRAGGGHARGTRERPGPHLQPAHGRACRLRGASVDASATRPQGGSGPGPPPAHGSPGSVLAAVDLHAIRPVGADEHRPGPRL